MSKELAAQAPCSEFDPQDQGRKERTDSCTLPSDELRCLRTCTHAHLTTKKDREKDKKEEEGRREEGSEIISKGGKERGKREERGGEGRGGEGNSFS